MSESTAEARREVEMSRERIAETVGELETRIADRVDVVRQRTDIGKLVREHPWPALAVALGAGVLLGSTGVDERAARATADAAKRASRATKDTAKGLVGKLHRPSASERSASDDADYEERGAAQGFGARMLALLSAPLVASLDVVLQEMRAASRELGSSMRARPVSSLSPRREAVHDETTASTAPGPQGEASTDVPAASLATTAADVPVPPEMMPSELDARADAVEALGGGSKEPPLVPGAGDLGARWA